MVLPHPTVPLYSIRPADISLLLSVAAILEFVFRTVTVSRRRRSSTEIGLGRELGPLRVAVAEKKAIGPAAFVETSKLERLVLAKEIELEKLKNLRTKRADDVEALRARIMRFLSLAVFAVYYGVPLLSLDGGLLVEKDERTMASLWEMSFPLPYTGIGYRLSQWGIGEGAEGLGALTVFWAAQVAAGELADCLLGCLVAN